MNCPHGYEYPYADEPTTPPDCPQCRILALEAELTKERAQVDAKCAAAALNVLEASK